MVASSTRIAKPKKWQLCLLKHQANLKLISSRLYFGDTFKVFKVLWVLIFLFILLVFSSLNLFKWLFQPIHLELDQVSAQMVDFRPESWHFWKSAHGLLGWGTTRRELKVPSGTTPLKKYIFFKPPNSSQVVD